MTTPFGVVIFMEQVRGIEPPCSAWEADILPLNYTCISDYASIAQHEGLDKSKVTLSFLTIYLQKIYAKRRNGP